MSQALACVSVLVRDYDEAIAWYTAALGFRLIEDSPQGGGKRWVLMAPRDDDRGTRLLLARAVTPAQAARIGDQTGGRVFLFLHTDDFEGDLIRLQANGGRLCEQPRTEAYGTVVVFEDLYGNRWDLIQPHRTDDRAEPAPRPAE
jgi:catechol 2,3-dioxygenase-like lactoylglutathione lyase family enzyme